MIPSTSITLTSVQNTFDGDGALAKSMVNGVTTCQEGEIYKLEDDGDVESDAQGLQLGGGHTAMREKGNPEPDPLRTAGVHASDRPRHQPLAGTNFGAAGSSSGKYYSRLPPMRPMHSTGVPG